MLLAYVFGILSSSFLVFSAPAHQSAVLERMVRNANRFNTFPMQNENAQSLGSEIRDEMHTPSMNINRNTGASSSSSITNDVLVNQGGNPSLKNGQGLGVAITIKGPLGTTSDTFANTAMFGTGPGDSGNTQAQAGRAGHNSAGSMTNTNVHLQNNQPGDPSFASSFNKANTNQFSSGTGSGNLFSSAGSFGDVSRR